MPEVNRSHTWLAIYADGTAAWERDFGSLRRVPNPDKVVRVALVASHDPDDPTFHHAVHVPPGATPVCFWRVPIRVKVNADGGLDQEASPITVIGWERESERCLLWVHADGSALLTDRDLEEL